MANIGDFRSHPPALWRHMFKIDLVKTMKRMTTMRADFERFPEHLPVGSEARNFTLRDASGAERSLAELRGKVVVLEFGAIT